MIDIGFIIYLYIYENNMSDIEHKGLFLKNTVTDILMEGGGDRPRCNLNDADAGSDTSYEPGYAPLKRKVDETLDEETKK